LKRRGDFFDSLFKKQGEAYASMPREPIEVTLPDGNVKAGTSFETTPLDIAKAISNSLAKTILVAKVKFSSRVATLDEGLKNPEEEGGENDGW